MYNTSINIACFRLIFGDYSYLIREIFGMH
jgi:hypothetical protein